MALGMVSIIVLNFNGLKNNFLPQCLNSLSKQTYKLLQIIVVDNASTDDSVKYVEEEFPNVLMIKNRQNLGFCRGNNIGFEKAIGDFVLFANNDTFFSEICIEKLLQAIEQMPQVGMIAPKLIRLLPDNHEPQIIDSAGLLLLNNFMLRDRGFGELDRDQYCEPMFLFAPCGAAAFFRKKALETVRQKCGELWDEDFVAYYEDGDLAWRIHQEGWKCLYLPEAVIVHYRGGSSPHNFFRKPFDFKVHTIKNRYLMLIKNASLKLIIKQWYPLLHQELLVWGYMVLHPNLLIAVVKALYKNIPTAVKKRQLIKPKVGRDSLLIFQQKPVRNLVK